VHVHSPGAPAPATAIPVEALQQLQEQVSELIERCLRLEGRDEQLQAQVSTVAHKLFVALGGDHRRKLRRMTESTGKPFGVAVAETVAEDELSRHRRHPEKVVTAEKTA
jgi:hypothetical protein